MKVTIIKNHLHYLPGDEVDVSDGTARYWLMVGVAVDKVDKPDVVTVEKTLTRKLKAAAPVKKKKKK